MLLRKEATLQGVTDVKVWDCGVQCYDTSVPGRRRQRRRRSVRRHAVPAVPDAKAEQKANPMLANFVKYTGADKADGFGVYAWAAVIAFRDAVNSIVEADGVNGVTRKSIFAA